ncbi:MAG: DUF2283 domain-containing protein [candidate division WOR-3 bacterium]
MGQVKVFYDRAGNTLTVWFGEKQDEYSCEETGDEVVLMKDKHGRVIGFEKLNFALLAADRLQVAFEAASV